MITVELSISEIRMLIVALDAYTPTLTNRIMKEAYGNVLDKMLVAHEKAEHKEKANE